MSTERIALITGGTDGIGKATAKRLLTEGWRVVIVGRNPARCDATAADLRLATGSDRISTVPADLSRLAEVRKAAEAFLEKHPALDFLFLNANAITQTRVITPEGFESNFALGYLGRTLLARKLENVLKSTPKAQVLTVVGLNVSRVDFDDLTMAKHFSSQEALARWQWATQVFTGEFNRRSPALMNIYIPGLVRTKILANEPQPMRTMVKIMNLIVGIPVGKAAENVFAVVGDVVRTGNKGVTYAWSKPREALDLHLQDGDPQRLWDVTESSLKTYL